MRLLRHVAVTIGGSVARFANLERSFKRRRPVPVSRHILARIEGLEKRLSHIEPLASVPAISPEAITHLHAQLSGSSEDILVLRRNIDRTQRRSAARAEALDAQIRLMQRWMSARIDAVVEAKMAELDKRLSGEFEQIRRRTVDLLAGTLESALLARISAIENNLVEQSQAIALIREKLLKTDDTLKRLLHSMEEICARAESRTKIPAGRAAFNFPSSAAATFAAVPGARFAAPYQLPPRDPNALEHEGGVRIPRSRHRSRTRRMAAESVLGFAVAGIPLIH
jgi:hypothetical protein